MATFKLSVVAPDRTIVEGEVKSVMLPGVMGYFGIMAHHEPLISALDTGIIEYQMANDERAYISITGGFLEVSEDSVIVLASSGELAHEIDIREAENDLEEARRALRGESSPLTSEEAQEKLRVAMNRVKTAQKIR